MLFQEVLQFRSKSIVKYKQFERTAFRTDAQKNAAEIFKKQETYTGVLCPGAKKRLTKAIELIVQAATKEKLFQFTHKKTQKLCTGRFKLNFITLTIHSPQKMIQGKDGHKKCLEPLLLWLRREYGLSMYVWKAELQTRGQLHYHITSDCFVPWEDLRNKWNQLQAQAGYLDAYFDQKGHYDANSTDVHSVYKVKDMAKYLKKSIFKSYKKEDNSIVSEFRKAVQNTASIGGKVWDCSLNLKSAKYYECAEDECSELFTTIDIEARKNGDNVFFSDSCTIYSFKTDTKYLLNERMQAEYLQKMEDILSFQRTPVKTAKKIPLIAEIQEKPVPRTVNYQQVDSFEKLIELKWLKEQGYYKQKTKPKIGFDPQINLFSSS